METKRWSIQIDITEDRDVTSARAVLSTGGIDDHMAGIGRARRNPIDRPVPDIGDELAVARALADLADRLHDATTQDIAECLGR
ncbi:dsRBD fold-containing protein [Nonomuraea sp. NPDC005983]|uniref:dsRBD fold-containing protein n=1 Tax=unclassified Nonomuraea TaxID=2593643 RepID=UPI00332CB8AC